MDYLYKRLLTIYFEKHKGSNESSTKRNTKAQMIFENGLINHAYATPIPVCATLWLCTQYVIDTVVYKGVSRKFDAKLNPTLQRDEFFT